MQILCDDRMKQIEDFVNKNDSLMIRIFQLNILNKNLLSKTNLKNRVQSFTYSQKLIETQNNII